MKEWKNYRSKIGCDEIYKIGQEGLIKQLSGNILQRELEAEMTG